MDEHLRSEASRAMAGSRLRLEAFFASLGAALYQCQFAEDMLAGYIATVFRISAANGRDEALEMLAEERKHPLGAVIKRLKEHVALSPETEALLKEFLHERNWLVHRLHHEGGEDIHSDVRFPALLKRVDDVRQRALHIQKEFGRLAIEYGLSQGIGKEHLNSDTIDRLDKLGNGEKGTFL